MTVANQLTNSSCDTSVDKVSTAGFAVVAYIRGVTDPLKRTLAKGVWLQLPKSPFRHWGIFSLNLRIMYRGSNGPTLFITTLAKSAIVTF